MDHEKTSKFLPDRRTFMKIAGAGASAAALLPGLPGAAAEAGYPDLAQLRARHEGERNHHSSQDLPHDGVGKPHAARGVFQYQL